MVQSHLTTVTLFTSGRGVIWLYDWEFNSLCCMVPPQFLLLQQLLNDYQTQEVKEPTWIFLYPSKHSETSYCSYLGFTCVHLSSNFRDVKCINFIDSSSLLAKDEFTILNERTLTERDFVLYLLNIVLHKYNKFSQEALRELQLLNI